MDLANASLSSTLQTARDRMREKFNGTLKAAKLQTSLASKIKSKIYSKFSKHVCDNRFSICLFIYEPFLHFFTMYHVHQSLLQKERIA